MFSYSQESPIIIVHDETRPHLTSLIGMIRLLNSILEVALPAAPKNPQFAVFILASLCRSSCVMYGEALLYGCFNAFIAGSSRVGMVSMQTLCNRFRVGDTATFTRISDIKPSLNPVAY